MQDKTLLIFAVMAGLFLVILYLAKIRVTGQKKVKQILSIKLNLLLKSLLICIQKQRGLCGRYANGDLLLKAEIEKHLVDNESLINSAEYQYSQFLNADPRWRTIRIDWSLLKTNVFLLDAENVFIYHNLLIENIIFMMEDVAYKGQHQDHNTVNDDEIRAIWSNIPQTLEAIGKTRVIGSGVAYEGICTKENKMKLKYLSDEIIRNYKYVSTHLGQITVDEMNGMPSQIALSIENFIIIVQDKLIMPEVPEVAAEVFFNQATQTMDGVSQLFDTLSTIKERQIMQAAA